MTGTGQAMVERVVQRRCGPALVPAAGRRPALIVIALAVLVLAVLAAVVWHGTTTAFDVWAFRGLDAHVGERTASALLDTSSPQIPVFLLVLVALIAATARRWDVVVFAAVSPAVALLVTEGLLKPVVGRRLGPGALEGALSASAPTAFPSGHETGVASTALVLVLLLHVVPLGRRARAAWPAVFSGWVLLAGVGLVRGHWHYLTDVVAAVAVCAAVVLATALVVDAIVRRLSSPGARSRPSTSPGA